MSKAMTFSELRALLNHIAQEHAPFASGVEGKRVKYVDPNIDMRDGAIFAVKFRGYGWEQTLHTQNECRDLPESLFVRCMMFLDEKD